LLEDLSYAVEDLEDVKPFFRVIDRLEKLRSYLSPNQEDDADGGTGGAPFTH
ncbi:hypothetical protein A2U01_0112767, partial [Trifolium medium]|nr:hypothetical protein [Trifolium medium]